MVTLSAPVSAGVKRSSSGRLDQAPVLAHRISGAGPTMEEAAAIAGRAHASAPQARFNEQGAFDGEPVSLPKGGQT